ncbi:MAG: hypothetical protein QM726_25775 [Chitinophagaceae bacterium]
MKKLLIIILAVCAAFAALNSCKKTGGTVNPLTDVNNLGIGSYLVIDSAIGDYLVTSNSASKVGIIVHQYPLGETVDHIQVVANLGTSPDSTTWKLVKSVPYTAGSKVTLTVTPTELATAFGTSASGLVPGSDYTFFTRAVTKSGKIFDINNAGDNGGGGLITGPAYASGFSFGTTIVCPFTGGMAGKYAVKKDDLQNWNVGDSVVVTDGPGANQINLSQVWPNPANASNPGTLVNPLIVKVDAATGAATVPNVDFGHYTANGGYTASTTDGSGYVFSCSKLISLTIELSFDGVDQGAYKLVLQR